MKATTAIAAFAATFMLLATAGCSNAVVSVNSMEKDECTIDKKRYTFDEVKVNYTKLAHEAVNQVFANAPVTVDRVLVTDFVDLTSLNNQSKFGYVLSNNIKNAVINTKNVGVVEAEVSKYFKISGNGLKVLSRDVETIRADRIKVQNALVGTYTYTEKEVVVFVKLIDLQTGEIKGSYSRTLPMNCAMMMMLSRA